MAWFLLFRSVVPVPPCAHNSLFIARACWCFALLLLQGLTGSVNSTTVAYCDNVSLIAVTVKYLYCSNHGTLPWLCAQLLKWTKDKCRGSTLTKLFTSVASNEDTNARLKAAVALFYVRAALGLEPAVGAVVDYVRGASLTLRYSLIADVF